MKEEFVGMWVLGIVSQYIVRLHRVVEDLYRSSLFDSTRMRGYFHST